MALSGISWGVYVKSLLQLSGSDLIFFGSGSGSGLENSDPDPTYIGRGIYSGKFAELGKGGKISL